MNRFKNILFVAEGSTGDRSALVKTLELVRLNKAKLTVMATVAELTSSSYLLSIQKATFSLQERLIRDRTRELEQLFREAAGRRNQLKSSLIVTSGKDYMEVNDAVRKNNYDLVIKAPSSTSKWSRILFGSLDLHLLRKCPCPVWIIKPRRKIRHSRILAAVDIAPEEKPSLDLNKTIMELASSLSRLEKGELHVINAWFLPEEAWLRSKQLSQYKSVNTLLRECRAMHKKNLDMLLSGFSSFAPRVHLIKGEPDLVIPRFVNNHGIDLLVMGTLARTGVAGLFMGNTAEKILNSVHCSVLAMKPDGFKVSVKI